jgi:hypothetical protein
MMRPVGENRESRSDFAQRHGMTTDEARIFNHLIEAANLCGELSDNYDKNVVAWMDKTQELYRLLMWRVVKRDHPEGWHSIREIEDRELGEEGEEGS